MEIINKMTEKFDEQGISLKVMEEMAELNEVLIKRVTKAEGFKPPLEKVSEEMGDLIFRMKILAKKLGIEKEVQLRTKQKAKQIDEWFKNKYEK